MTPEPPPPGQAVRAQHDRAVARMVRAWDLRAKGWSRVAIAADLGVSRQAVDKMLRKAENQALKRLERRVKATKARQAFQLEHMIAEAAEAWERSKKPGRKRRVTTDADGTTTTRETTGRDGDPRFLAEIRQLLAAERTLWGLDRPGAGDDDDDGGGFDDVLAAVREEAEAGLTPAERRARRLFRAKRLRAELAALETDLETDADEVQLPPAEGDDPGRVQPPDR